MDIAIAVFSFRRPDKLRLVLEALRGAKVAKLYHFCDGPRNAADEQLCAENRQIAQSVDTGIPTEYQLREKNIGLTQNLIGGIDQVLSKHDAIIVLEDDIVPTTQFFDFIINGLNRFKERQDIFSISGYHPLSHTETPAKSAFLSQRFFCWGWATWANHWQSISAQVKNGDSPYPHYWLVPETAGTDFRWSVRSWRLGRKALVWDQRVALWTLAKCLHHVCPPTNLISNVGFDGSGEHCPDGVAVTAMIPPQNTSDISLNPCLAPDPVTLNRIKEKYTLVPSSPLKRFIRRATYRLRTGV